MQTTLSRLFLAILLTPALAHAHPGAPAHLHTDGTPMDIPGMVLLAVGSLIGAALIYRAVKSRR